jgi:hypothetical protein
LFLSSVLNALPYTAKRGGKGILKRLLRYSDKVYDLNSHLQGIRDGRIRPRIKTPIIAGSALVMALTQMGSLNAIEQTEGHHFWKRWLNHDYLPSADAIGTVFSSIDCDALRGVLRHLYSRLKRNKMLRPAFSDNLFALELGLSRAIAAELFGMNSRLTTCRAP